MAQETDASHLTAESAPANEDDTASSDGNSDIEAAASAPHSPFSSDVEGDALYEGVFSWPCCGPYAREPDWAEPVPSNPDYGNMHPPTAMNWWLTAAGQPVSAPTVFNSTNAIRRWPNRAPSIDELRARVAREGWSYEPPRRLIDAHPMNRAGTGVDPHRAHEPLMDISRQGWSTESPRSSVTAASSSEPSAVSARPPTTVPQSKVIYKTPPGYNPPKAPQPGGSPPFNAPPTSAPPVKAPPTMDALLAALPTKAPPKAMPTSNLLTMAPRIQVKNPPPKRGAPVQRNFQGMFGTHGA